MEYLYSQTGKKWCPINTNDPDTPDQFEDVECDDGLDEGFEEGEFNDLTVPPLLRTITTGNKTMSLEHILTEK